MENGCETMLSLFKRQHFLCLSMTRSSGALTDFFSASHGGLLTEAVW